MRISGGKFNSKRPLFKQWYPLVYIMCKQTGRQNG